MATSGYFYMATSGDFLMAMDIRPDRKQGAGQRRSLRDLGSASRGVVELIACDLKWMLMTPWRSGACWLVLFAAGKAPVWL